MKNRFFDSEKNKALREAGAGTEQPSSGSRPRVRFNLRIKLPLTVISLLFLAFLGVTILSVNVSKATLTETLKQNLATEAALRAESIRSHLTWTQAMAVDLSTVAEAIELDEETSKSAIKQMLSRNRQVVGSTLAYEPYKFNPDMEFWAPYYNRTSDGALQFTQLGTPENNYPAQDWYKLAKQANAIILSPPYFDIGGAKIWMVTWSVPFYDASGLLRGIATTDIAFSQTEDIVHQIAVGEQGYAFLVDTNGVVLGMGQQGGQYEVMEESLFISNPSEQATDWNQLISEMTKGSTGFEDLIDPQGRAMFVAYQPIGMNTGWSLALAYPQDELFQPAVQLQNNLISLSMVVLVIASVLLFFFSQSITRPLQEITSWAKLISQRQYTGGGEQSLRPLHIRTNDEIEELADTFNHMSNELGQAFTTLEDRVANRTKALITAAEVSRHISNSIHLERKQLITDVVERVNSSFNYYHTQIYFFLPPGNELVLEAATGEAGKILIQTGHRIPKGKGLVGRAAETNAPVLVSDVTADRDWLPNPLLPETKSELAVPISSGETVIGVIDVQHNMPNGLTRQDEEVLQTVASQMMIAAQNARLLFDAHKQAEREALITTINQKIQSTTTVESALQIAVREIGRALGSRASVRLAQSRNGHENRRSPRILEEAKHD